MNKIIAFLSCILLSMFLTGCVAPYVEPQFNFPPQKLGNPPISNTMSKLVIFNDSNFLINSPTKIKVILDNKIVGQLHYKEFLIIDIKKGEHTLKLEHKDMITFKSNHTINVAKEETFLKIIATMMSNTAKIVSKPSNFNKRFSQAYLGSDDLK
jgi:hypothetical protein